MKKLSLILLLFYSLLTVHSVSAKTASRLKIEMLDWNEVDQILPKYTKFTVMDLETGKKFNVQRRAGSHHADVQPLTAEDTKTMKEIYGGKWSWKRRAIIAIYKKQRIAASMHGMPHGAGALKNNFPGHFCIYFYGSTTHRTNKMDLSHMLMIYKASGNLDKYLGQANPYEVIEAYIAGFKQQDSRIVSKASLQAINWKPILKKVDNARIIRMEYLPPEDLKNEIYLEVPVEVDWNVINKGPMSYKGIIHLVRFSPAGSWKIDSDSFLDENHFP
ncbi:hypothetical protein [Neobacillus muris]|uniref:hypothetical protein n=1 Tax=Neobacillus muris TaxID=2941334 RepID=UPI0020422030|nr:hypothetical protein [Neobacillus muris]